MTCEEYVSLVEAKPLFDMTTAERTGAAKHCWDCQTCYGWMASQALTGLLRTGLPSPVEMSTILELAAKDFADPEAIR